MASVGAPFAPELGAWTLEGVSVRGAVVSDGTRRVVLRLAE